MIDSAFRTSTSLGWRKKHNRFSQGHAGVAMQPLKFAPVALALALCAAQAPVHAQATHANGLSFAPGVYKCELNRSVHVRQVSSDMQSAVLNWDKKDYTMKAVTARTGALRYEDSASGLVWLVIVGKSMLLDTKNGKQLANECRT